MSPYGANIIMGNTEQVEIEFIRSATEMDSKVCPNADIREWVIQKNREVVTVVNQLPLDRLRNWRVDPTTGNISHETGRFFSVEGIRVKTDWGTVAEWDQPIINQPEIGFLGLLGKKFHGVLHFLMQAKIEPGNINTVQISPTVQATKSNYMQVHKGKRPLFLEYFNGEKRVNYLLDQLQSEQGARFLKKRNRNIIVEIAEGELISEHENFTWMTIGQLKQLMREDNIVNMDTRTVLSGIGYGSYITNASQSLLALNLGRGRHRLMVNSALNSTDCLHDFRYIISWITKLKSKYELNVEKVALNQARNWKYEDGEIRHVDRKYFSVIGVNVQIDNREVVSWDQPMIKPAQEGLIGFIVKPINGVYHFLLQAKLEAGNFDIIELAPTVQCLTGNYRTGLNEYSVKYISEVLTAPAENIIYSAMQSEEGGRFFKEQNRNVIVEVGDEFPIEVDDKYCWMTLNQILKLIEFNNYLNIAARSLISAITYA